jgi:methionyl-tRNA synthetase
MERVLATLYGCIRDLAVAVSPVIPEASAKILDAMCIPGTARDFAALERDAFLDTVRVDNPKPVFPRLEMPENEAA